MKLVEAEVNIERVAEITRTSVEEIKRLVETGFVRSETGSKSPIRFSDICSIFAISAFRRAGHPDYIAVADDAASLCRLPMMAFASHLAAARYGVEGSVAKTTHSSHVPERYVIMSGADVCRVGTMEAYERTRFEDIKSYASIFVFDTKVAAEYIIDAINTCPFRWV